LEDEHEFIYPLTGDAKDLTDEYLEQTHDI